MEKIQNVAQYYCTIWNKWIIWNDLSSGKWIIKHGNAENKLAKH
jgi:hypothetical protein